MRRRHPGRGRCAAAMPLRKCTGNRDGSARAAFRSQERGRRDQQADESEACRGRLPRRGAARLSSRTSTFLRAASSRITPTAWSIRRRICLCESGPAGRGAQADRRFCLGKTRSVRPGGTPALGCPPRRSAHATASSSELLASRLAPWRPVRPPRRRPTGQAPMFCRSRRPARRPCESGPPAGPGIGSVTGSIPAARQRAATVGKRSGRRAPIVARVEENALSRLDLGPDGARDHIP